MTAPTIPAGSVSLDRFPVGLGESWKRSIEHGLRRQDRALFSHCVSKALTKRVVEDNDALISHARDEMPRLQRSLDSARWLTLCTNAQGQIVHFVGDRTSAPRELQMLMYPGRRLLEAELGTTAPGAVLQERRPVVVTRGEHFLLELENFFCASAPIFDPASHLLGVLDISGVDVRSLPLAQELVDLAARRIENNVVCAQPDCTALHFHSDERLLGSPFEAILAVDLNGVIKGLNRTARQLLSSNADKQLLGRSFDALIDGGLDQIERKMRDESTPFVSVRSVFGCLSFVKTEFARRTCRAARPLSSDAVTSGSRADSLICGDPTLMHAFSKAVKVLRAGLPVVVCGETGTGKELFVRAMHREVRPRGPFVALNCAAIPETLIEAELFGFADGAFTGARKGGSKGKVEQANGGILFLDEAGDMPASMQTKLLRVLQERVVTRVGESRENPVDLLVVAATHRNLSDLVAQGTFREDLYYRLEGYSLELPPLRERTDLRALIHALLLRWSKDSGAVQPIDGSPLITNAAIDCLANYNWPGNVRQLEQSIRRLLALRESLPIDVEDLPREMRVAHSLLHREAASEPRLPLELVELEAIRQAVAVHDGNISAAARALGIARGTLYKKLRTLKAAAHTAA